MIEVKTIPLSKILKIDLSILLENTILILEAHNPEALRLQDIYEVLKQQEAKVQIFDFPYGEHKLTPELAKLHKKRLKYASLIYAHVNTLANVDDKETQQMAEIAKRLPKLHLTYLGQKTISDVNSKIWLFFSLLKLDDYCEDRKAFVGLGLQSYLNELQKTNTEYNRISNERTRDKKERPPTGDPLLEKETKKIIRMFFEQVNSYQLVFKDIDYAPFIKMLNIELTKHSKLIKTRLATNKRRARKKKALAAKEAAAKEASKKAKDATKDESNIEVKPMNASSAATNANATTKNKEKEDTEQSSIKGGAKPKEAPKKDGLRILKKTNKKGKRGKK